MQKNEIRQKGFYKKKMNETSITETAEFVADAVMTNFDHTIDAAIALKLKNNPKSYFAQYAGYNFCGYVYFDIKWKCEIWQYNSFSELITTETLEEMMEEISDKYGAE